MKWIDRDYRNHLQAFLNFMVQAKKRSGKNSEKPVYRTFKKFYDYKNELDKVDGKEEKSRFSGLGDLLKKQKGE